MSDGTLAGRHAIVTGGAGGIGRAIVAALARRGARVTIADLADPGDLVARMRGSGLDVRGGQVNVTDAGDVARFVEGAARQAGTAAILVNCAGGGARATFADTTDEIWFADLNSNLTGTFFMIRAVLPGMVARGDGAIVNISSISGVIGGLPSQGASGRSGPAYAAAKGGVIALTKWAAREYGRHGIRVNAIAPGPVLTPADMEGYDYGVESYPIPRFGTSEDIAEAVAFLVSPGSGYVTGECLKVSGGVGM